MCGLVTTLQNWDTCMQQRLLVLLVSVTSILGGVSDNTGSGIAHRSVLKTGLNIILACSIPKNSPMLETQAEKILIQKLISLGYTKSGLGGTS
ncbi:hypothetical protein GLYMA_09G078800v4 [Glycine max]|nr:hypothetical protein GLYMA_09G078800v4 [Glycine max]